MIEVIGGKELEDATPEELENLKKRINVKGDIMNKNAEGYPDTKAGTAWKNIRKEENRKEMEQAAVISSLILIIKQTAELAGFEVVGRIVLKDKRTGKEYR